MIGNGNVALDVARMLALTPEELAPTDTTDPAIEAIGASRVREIVVVGRRGPAQASWTTQELKEMGELAGADVAVDPADLELDPASEAALEHDTNARRNMDVLREFANRESTGNPLTVRFLFFHSPVAVRGDEKVEAIELVRTRLEEQNRRLVAVPTDESRQSQRRTPCRRSNSGRCVMWTRSPCSTRSSRSSPPGCSSAITSSSCDPVTADVPKLFTQFRILNQIVFYFNTFGNIQLSQYVGI